MAGAVKIGDCLMLSQKAWKCSRSFTGPKSTPPEFKEIEHELARLAKSLKLLAECMFAEKAESLLAAAGDGTKKGISLILDYCKYTLTNLESLIEQYQNQDSEGFSVQKTWSDLVLANYKQFMWTVDGGSIFILRDLLHMHVSTTAIVRQALESNSRDRVEWTVSPIAERIQAMATQDDRDTSEQIEGIERIVQSLLDQSPTLGVAFDRVNSVGSDLSLPSIGLGSQRGPGNSTRASTPTRTATPSTLSNESQPDSSNLSRAGTISQGAPPLRAPSRNKELRTLEIRSKTSVPSSIASSYYSPTTSPDTLSGSELAPSEAGMWENTSSVGFPSPHLPIKSTRRHWKPPDTRQVAGKSLPAVPKTVMVERARTEQALSMPALPTPPDSDVEHKVNYPLLHQRQRAPSVAESIVLPPSAWEDDNATIKDTSQYSLMPSSDAEAIMLGKHMSTISQQENFEKEVFKNSAIYCDLRAKQVEFVLPSKDESRPHETRLESAMRDCRICLVRRRETYSNGEPRFTTSIWAFSDDRTMRLQQSIPDGEELVPFPSYFQDEKISITIPTDLTFHSLTYGAPPIRTERSKWVNYIFEDEAAATTFGNALFGKTLLDNFKTEKTTRLRDGIKGAMAYQEQMCGMENLRLWSQEPSGAVLAMIHFSAMFRKGWLQFVINDKDQPIKVKDDGGKAVKLKGLRIPDGEYPEELRKNKKSKDDLKKYITGAKVEFKDVAEKYRFLTVVRELQISAVTLGANGTREMD
ncbi:uncharacterized protein PV09_00036 [Verruconis gallopava]|uniref:Fungal N-terminal domain-containing protein n=1 Tax=Verruconis gallopava TaxID=253628 RepID=A0A0D1Y226_9PEZI|nr:uncharacterized protein PV09_00036 [Verruconis gallopava]KIW09091.1 hypothetical protein PV09_00036 [Verruconis gallopava]